MKKRTKEMKRPTIAAALIASLFAAPALAASDDFQLAVTFDRAAVETPEGAKAEYVKIHDEVAERCTAEHASFPMGRDFAASICTARTMQKAVNAINSPELTKVHAARTAG
tara:strand:+ start:6132 stop:6464 length:333 start_codon:yes stop_codon:yes gene_type:complete